MHSGLLFLFPHYYKVVQAAERCHNVDFDSRANMWFNPAIPSYNISSEIPCDVCGCAPVACVCMRVFVVVAFFVC